MKIDTYDKLSENNKVYISLSKGFIQKLRKGIIRKYETLANYNRKELKINYGTLKMMFSKNAKTYNFSRIIKIAEHIGISHDEV